MYITFSSHDIQFLSGLFSCKGCYFIELSRIVIIMQLNYRQYRYLWFVISSLYRQKQRPRPRRTVTKTYSDQTVPCLMHVKPFLLTDLDCFSPSHGTLTLQQSFVVA